MIIKAKELKKGMTFKDFIGAQPEIVSVEQYDSYQEVIVHYADGTNDSFSFDRNVMIVDPVQTGVLSMPKSSVCQSFVITREDGHELSYSGLDKTLIHFDKFKEVKSYGMVLDATKYLHIASEFMKGVTV